MTDAVPWQGHVCLYMFISVVVYFYKSASVSHVASRQSFKDNWTSVFSVRTDIQSGFFGTSFSDKPYQTTHTYRCCAFKTFSIFMIYDKLFLEIFYKLLLLDTPCLSWVLQIFIIYI